MTASSGTPRRTRRSGLDVVALVKQFILDRQMEPGDTMPTEAELADLLGASRSNIREAIKTLVALDIVEVRHGYGTFVGQMSMEPMVQSLAFRAAINPNDGRLVLAELVEVREILELSLVEAMLDNIRGALILTLRRLTATMAEKAALDQEFRAEDREFHLLLISVVPNNLIQALTGGFWDVHAIVSKTLQPARDLAATAQAHEAILDAIELRDSSALRAAIKAHYQPLRSRLLEGDSRQ